MSKFLRTTYSASFVILAASYAPLRSMSISSLYGGNAFFASASDFTYNTTVKTYQMYRSYTAITEYKYSSPLDVITAGVSCCRIDTGANVGDGWLTENKNSRKATASEAISYNPYSMSVRGFGSHSAYENGQTVLYKFTQSSAA